MITLRKLSLLLLLSLAASPSTGTDLGNVTIVDDLGSAEPMLQEEEEGEESVTETPAVLEDGLDLPPSPDEDFSLDANLTLSETNVSSSDNSSRVFAKRVVCLVKNATDEGSESATWEEPSVGVVNGSAFLQILLEQADPNVTNRTLPAQCSLGFFFASWCPFSARAAPHFNGLARVFPDVKMMAIDTGKYHGINTQFGIMALPTMILFHNSKPAAKYNLSEFELEHFAKYLTLFTGLEAKGELNLTEADFEGPVPTKAVPEPDYYLYLAWIFTIVCMLCYFGKSSFCKKIVESVRNTWREAEMHEHQE